MMQDMVKHGGFDTIAMFLSKYIKRSLDHISILRINYRRHIVSPLSVDQNRGIFVFSKYFSDKYKHLRKNHFIAYLLQDSKCLIGITLPPCH